MHQNDIVSMLSCIGENIVPDNAFRNGSRVPGSTITGSTKDDRTGRIVI